jgi:predicted RNA binding protein YcfA (HicA-like mRNA interferase family)
MTKAPRLSGHRLVMALQKAGFEVIRIKGSHYFLKHKDVRGTVIPVHRGETLGPEITAHILKDCEISYDELRSLL